MDTIKNMAHAVMITLFAQTPDLLNQFNWEKLGFASILFFVIWWYMNKILPKTQETIDRQQKKIEELTEKLGQLQAGPEKSKEPHREEPEGS